MGDVGAELRCRPCAIRSDARLGTVGKLLPGLEGKIAEDGEFLVRGPLVMKGYRKEPAKTAEAIDADGWLHTGDILEVDADGYLRVVDRKKELIINAAGKNMSPANIENTILAACPMVGVMITIGDGRPYNTALHGLRRRLGRSVRGSARSFRRLAGGPGGRPGGDRADRRRGGRRATTNSPGWNRSSGSASYPPCGSPAATRSR